MIYGCSGIGKTGEVKFMQGNTQLLDVGKVNDHYFLNFWEVVADTSTNIDAV